MRLGILSDTHDQSEMMRSAIKTLLDEGAEFLVHCGDVGNELMLDLLAGIPAAFVWGNNDWDRARLAGYATNLGIQCHGDFARLEFDGKKIAVTHGDENRLIRRAMMPGQFDYFLHGHTHVAKDERINDLRIINPGALYRAARKTAAILDVPSDTLRFLTIKR